MKTLARQVAVYATYHRNPWNRLTHFLGVPLIILSLFVAMGGLSWSVAGYQVSLDVLFAAIVLAYYLTLDAPLALGTAAPVAALLWLTQALGVDLGPWQRALVFAFLFALGWILQLLGHAIEGRRPALVDNFWQVFVAPLFLVTEVCFALGLRRELRDEIQRAVDAETANREPQNKD